MTTVRLGLPAVFMLVALASAGAFAVGRSMPASPEPSPTAFSSPTVAVPTVTFESDEPLPPGHPPTTGGLVPAPGLPAGHPSVDPSDHAGAPESQLQWTAPPRWQLVTNANTMRLATYRVPPAPGDADAAELSITAAGGSVDANVERWVGQFDAAGQKTAKRGTRKVGALEVTIVEVQGTFSGGMGKEPSSGSGWALLGAIVATPGMPHFFKLTGPAKSVLAAGAELDEMIASLVLP